MSETAVSETIPDFSDRAATWMERNLPSWDDEPANSHQLQQRLFDHGFAGIPFPIEYGGAGLTLDHQKAFFDLAADLRRQVPSTYMVSIGMLGPTILDHGSHAAKLRFLPRLLRGDEVWIQLLSEPRGGSDLAGSDHARLLRDGDSYVLSGAKMWSTGAHEADYGLCLCRSDWQVPKHRGLTMIAVPLREAKGITIQQTRAADGTIGEFCEEFFDDVVLPAENVIGQENQGWAVAQGLLLHERNAVGNIGYGYLHGRTARRSGSGFGAMPATNLATEAHRRGVTGATGQLLADVYIESIVGPLTSARIMTGLNVGTHKGQWGSLSKLQSSVAGHRAARTALAAYGADGVIWEGDDVQLDNPGTAWLGARGGTIAGGTNEMQRNIIAERLLDLPREPAPDRDLPFGEVIRNLGK